MNERGVGSGEEGVLPKECPSRNWQRPCGQLPVNGGNFQSAIAAPRLDLISCRTAPSAEMPDVGYGMVTACKTQRARSLKYG